MGELRAFVRGSGWSNDDARACLIPRGAVVSELLAHAIPHIFPQDACPHPAELAVWVDGAGASPLRSRAVVEDCVDDINAATFVIAQQRKRDPDALSTDRPGTSVSPQRREAPLSPSRSRVVQNLAGAAEGKLSVLASGEGMPPPDRHPGSHRRRAAGQEQVRFTASSLPVDMRDGGAPSGPTGARRTDALTLVTGDVHNQCDPPRFRRAHGQNCPPHLQSSADDWWGHRGGYTRQRDGHQQRVQHTPARKERCSRGDAQDQPEAVRGSWLRSEVYPRKGPGLAAPRASCESHVAAEGAHLQPAQGQGVPFYDRPAGKRQLGQEVTRAQSCQLGCGSLTSPPPQRGGKRQHAHHDSLSMDASPPPPTRQQRCDPLSAAAPPYGTCGDAAPTAQPGTKVRTNPTTQSSVGLHMRLCNSDLPEDEASTPEGPPEERVEQSMKRKGRAAPPSSYGPTQRGDRRPPPASLPRDHSVGRLRRVVVDRIAALGGKGSTGDLAGAWRTLAAEASPAGCPAAVAAERGVDLAGFCRALRTVCGVEVPHEELPALLRRSGDGATTARVTFRELAELLKSAEDVGALLPSDAPGSARNRALTGDRGLRCHLQQQHSTPGRPPYGTAGDGAQEPHQGRRRWAAQPSSIDIACMSPQPAAPAAERAARHF
eukprot:TRINITY_DN14838_c0_g1_i2.p2 TRINITY_DN14838_c0_g1~~TRINITY_DN14838_c0_g1_i2.p2  ORF type:complete len:682 (+),score=212.92 TRINITY_DN14838_c0_g1_i2:74-2047(+)